MTLFVFSGTLVQFLGLQVFTMNQSTIFAPRQGTLGSWHPGGPFSIHPGKVKKKSTFKYPCIAVWFWEKQFQR
jgi:hypothetical protein